MSEEKERVAEEQRYARAALIYYNGFSPDDGVAIFSTACKGSGVHKLDARFVSADRYTPGQPHISGED